MFVRGNTIPHLHDGGDVLFIEVGIVNPLHSTRDGCDGEVVRVAERRFAAKTKASYVIIGIRLRGFEVDRVDVVDVLVRDASSKVLDGDPWFKDVGKLDVEGFGLPRSLVFVLCHLARNWSTVIIIVNLVNKTFDISSCFNFCFIVVPQLKHVK